MIIKAFIYHKRAEKYSDCQDCFGINAQNNRIAVSDGMSQSIFPQWWAKILVDYYLKHGYIPKDIIPLQAEWQQMLLAEIQRREEEALTNPKRDPWRLKNQLAEKSGAGATFCGVTFGKSKWSCECIGDSCLIAVDEKYSLTFYTSQIGEFGNHPDYLDSFSKGRGEVIHQDVIKTAKYYLLVSDPFSELFHKNQNDKTFIKQRIDEIITLNNHTEYKNLVEGWRDEWGMHNDDSTLIFIEKAEQTGIKIIYQDNLEQLSDINSSSTSENINTSVDKIEKLLVDKSTDELIAILLKVFSLLLKRPKLIFKNYKDRKKNKCIKGMIMEIFKPEIEKFKNQ